MKLTGMAAVALVLAAAGLANAVEPTPATIRMPSTRSTLLNGANWWSRYGEPVNRDQIDAAPAEAVATPVGWHENGHGYIYGLGTCDYTLPCTDWLWEDYQYDAWRCHGYHGCRLFGRHCGHCGGGHCGHCGGHGDCGCGKAIADCGCAEKVPACDAAPSCDAHDDCGCGVAHKCCVLNHFHWHWKKKCFWHRNCGCDTCDIGCGCAAPIADAPIGDAPVGAEQAPPKPTPDPSQKASLVWPFGPVR